MPVRWSRRQGFQFQNPWNGYWNNQTILTLYHSLTCILCKRPFQQLIMNYPRCWGPLPLQSCSHKGAVFWSNPLLITLSRKSHLHQWSCSNVQTELPHSKSIKFESMFLFESFCPLKYWLTQTPLKVCECPLYDRHMLCHSLGRNVACPPLPLFSP